jgi:myo-inositol-1(or 4)-monophosphatase
MNCVHRNPLQIGRIGSKIQKRLCPDSSKLLVVSSNLARGVVMHEECRHMEHMAVLLCDSRQGNVYNRFRYVCGRKDPTVSDILQFVEVMSRQAGAILMDGFGHVRHVYQKGVIDLVTEFDKRSEELILSSIQENFPAHAILAEESGHNQTISEYQWVIDPLDGTTNFSHGIPVFSVSIGLLKNHSPVVGVVYDPFRNEMFSAEAGHGAFLNNHPIHVSSQTDLGHAVISTGFPYDLRTNPQNNLAQFVQFQLRTQAVRHLGSAALDCSWTAMGRLDGYWEFGTKPWDVGAGTLIVREAGGRVTSTDGGEDYLASETIVVSNRLLHEQMLCVLKEGSDAPLPQQYLAHD